jgi:hypothetical protein
MKKTEHPRQPMTTVIKLLGVCVCAIIKIARWLWKQGQNIFIQDEKIAAWGTVIAAIATAFIAFFYWSLIHQNQEMVRANQAMVDSNYKIMETMKETYKLAVKQFQIQSYPILSFRTPKITKDDGKWSLYLPFSNHSPNAVSHETQSLVVLRSGETANRLEHVTYIYKGEKVDSFFAKRTIPPGESITHSWLEFSEAFKDKDTLFLIARFRIPYRDKYDYSRVFPYIYKEAAGEFTEIFSEHGEKEFQDVIIPHLAKTDPVTTEFLSDFIRSSTVKR